MKVIACIALVYSICLTDAGRLPDNSFEISNDHAVSRVTKNIRRNTEHGMRQRMRRHLRSDNWDSYLDYKIAELEKETQSHQQEMKFQLQQILLLQQQITFQQQQCMQNHQQQTQQEQIQLLLKHVQFLQEQLQFLIQQMITKNVNSTKPSGNNIDIGKRISTPLEVGQTGGDGDDINENRKISLTKHTPNQPIPQQPSVEHGQTETTTRAPTVKLEKCKTALLICCNKDENEKKNCLTEFGCPKLNDLKPACSQIVLKKIIEEFIAAYAPDSL